MSGRDIDNCYDYIGTTRRINYMISVDFPGDTSALCSLRLKQINAVGKKCQYIFLDREHRRYNAWFEAEDYIITGSSQADVGNCSSDAYSTTTVDQESPNWVKSHCLNLQLPSNTLQYGGFFRLYGRARDEETWNANGEFQFGVSLYGTTSAAIYESAIVEGNGKELFCFDGEVFQLQPIWGDLGKPLFLSIVIKMRKKTGQANFTQNLDWFFLAPLYQPIIVEKIIAASDLNRFTAIDSQSNRCYMVDAEQKWAYPCYGWVGQPLTIPASTSSTLYFIAEDTNEDVEVDYPTKAQLDYRPRGLHFRGSDL